MLKLATAAESEPESQFLALYRTHFVAIHRYAVRLSGDLTQAEDITQEVFLRLWKEFRATGEPANTRAWLFRVTSNLVVSRFRARSRALRFLLPSDAAAHRTPVAADNVEREAMQRQIVRLALARLPEPMRQSLLLHHEGLTGREIGEVLGVKPSYVSTLVFRAHERFRRECNALGGQDGVLR